jgi:flagellar basal body rod protein FlgC
MRLLKVKGFFFIHKIIQTFFKISFFVCKENRENYLKNNPKLEEEEDDEIIDNGLMNGVDVDQVNLSESEEQLIKPISSPHNNTNGQSTVININENRA